jgi:nucleolar protein 15
MSDLEPSHSEEDEPEVPQEEGSPGEEDVHLYGFSTDEDSSDDDLDVDEEAALDVGSLPTVARDDATVKRKLEKAKRKPASETGVVYLSRIPHGFYEDQMRAYFSQFGEISRLRLSRNKRTGKSKHYGFIEFVSAPVAQIVAETMDNYLLMSHIMTCKVIPKDEVHPELWVGANRKWRIVPTYRLAQAQHNKPRNEMQQRAAEKRLLNRQEARKRKLAEAGIVYNFEKVGYKKSKSTA